MSEKERMMQGLIYDPCDQEISNEQKQCLDYMYDYNLTRAYESDKRKKLLQLALGKYSEGAYIEPPFYANWGGKHLFLGKNVYINFNFGAVDDGNIYIDDYTMIGPNVCIATANHVILPSLRIQGYQYAKDVHIEENVWIGANVVIVPGITIGANSIIGAGSVVTKNIPAGVIAVGNPCRVLREISERDQEYFYKNEKIDWEYFK